MTRNTLIAAAILTVAPLAAQAQDGYDYKAMDAARRAAARSVASLTAEINTLSHRLPEIDDELQAAYRAYRIRLAQFDDNDRRTLAEKRARLTQLGSDTPYRAPANATEAQRKRHHEAWLARRRERQQLNQDVAALVAQEHAFDAAREAYQHKTTHKQMVERRYNQLKAVRKTQARNYMIEQGRKHGWSLDILRLRYPELF